MITIIQESLANATVSAQCACMKAPSKEIYDKSMQGTKCWKVHSVGYSDVADSKDLSSFVQQLLPLKSAKSREILRKYQIYSSSRSSKVIDLGANRIRNFLLVVNSNFGRISYRFRDIDAFRSKITFSPSHPCLMTRCCKMWHYSSARSSKVIDLDVNRKLICDFLLVINSNFGRICCRFRDTNA